MIFYENISRFSAQIKFNLRKILLLLVLVLKTRYVFRNKNYFNNIAFQACRKTKTHNKSLHAPVASRFHEKTFYIDISYVVCVCALGSFFISNAKYEELLNMCNSFNFLLEKFIICFRKSLYTLCYNNNFMLIPSTKEPRTNN